jgi:tetratricopeptide (TPR) repeat protein
MKRIREGATALALGVACVGGCQQFNRSPVLSSLVSAREEGTGKVTARQAADVQFALGRTFEQRGDTVQAMAVYQEAVKRDPKRTDALVRLAILYDQQGKFRESAEWYRKALQSAPGNPDIFCNMGYSLYLQRRWAEAEMNLQQALTLKPDHVRARNNLGLVMAHTDRLDQALAQFRQTGNECEARLNLALALTMDRRWEEARGQYEAALAAHPSSEAAQNGLRQLDTLLARTTPPASVAPVLAPREPAVEVVKIGPAYRSAPPPDFSAPALPLPKVVPVSLPETSADNLNQPAVLDKPHPGLSLARTFFHLDAQEAPVELVYWSSTGGP